MTSTSTTLSSSISTALQNPVITMSPFLLLLLLLLLSTAVTTTNCSSPTHFSAATLRSPNPLSPKASLIRYWSFKIPNNQPMPHFLLSKASPLSAPDSVLYQNLAAQKLLSSRLRPFCSAARLLCFPSLSPGVDQQLSRKPDAHFSQYSNINFTNYGTVEVGGFDSFKNYSDDRNVPLDTFRRYNRDSDHRDSEFTFYSPSGNVVTTNFSSYATAADGGSGDFASYHRFANVPDLKFNNYDASAKERDESFTSYADDTNAGGQSFSGYGKNSADVPTGFSSYAKNSNVMGSSFKAYGERGTNPNDTFTSYGFNGNVPQNSFRSYADGGKGEVLEKFSSYRDDANVGDDNFKSYLKGTASAKAQFKNYGQSANIGTDNFRGYGEKADLPTVGFTTYGMNNTFKEYSNKGSTTFSDYRNTSSAQFANIAAVSDGVRSGRLVNRWVEPGKFFRESQLRTGTIMPMADIRDKMPDRAFLPRSIAAKLPFSTARMEELNRVFNATIDTGFAKKMASTVAECERAPSRGESKRCVTSVEDMIDFATTMLGKDVVVRSTESTGGWGRHIRIGKVVGINGGKVTKSVSCHQSLFPYLVYYCHCVPKVRAYEAEILAVDSETVINHGVAICHLDTSNWSASHGAFVALGPGPGKIEVCHWIFRGDMTWAVADRT